MRIFGGKNPVYIILFLALSLTYRFRTVCRLHSRAYSHFTGIFPNVLSVQREKSTFIRKNFLIGIFKKVLTGRNSTRERKSSENWSLLYSDSVSLPELVTKSLKSQTGFKFETLETSLRKAPIKKNGIFFCVLKNPFSLGPTQVRTIPKTNE